MSGGLAARDPSRDGVTREVRAGKKQEPKGRDGWGGQPGKCPAQGTGQGPGEKRPAPIRLPAGVPAAAALGTDRVEPRRPLQGPHIRARGAAISRGPLRREQGFDFGRRKQIREGDAKTRWEGLSPGSTAARAETAV